MHILLLTDSFAHESRPHASRTYEHAREWVRLGCSVNVVTPAGNYASGGAQAELSTRGSANQSLAGIGVVRVKTCAARRAGRVWRWLHDLSFLVSGTLAALRRPAPDVMIAVGPQRCTLFAGRLSAWCKRVPFVVEVVDLWPAATGVAETGGRGLLRRLLERLELAVFRSADAVVPITESLRAALVARGVAASRVSVVTNGVDLEHYRPRRRDLALAERLGLTGKTVIGCLGLHDRAPAIECVLEAAEVLRQRHDIVFLHLGSGEPGAGSSAPGPADDLANVRLLPTAGRDERPAHWGLCDAALVHCENRPQFEASLPAEIFEAMGMGVPILYAGPDGEASKLVRRTGAGLCVSPENLAALAAAVERLADDPVERSRLAANSRAAAPGFDRSHLAHAILGILSDVADVPNPAHRDGRRSLVA